MNTWRDIKTAPLNQAVFATDGDMVFFGRFAMTADRKCMFEGQDIEEACNYGIEPACLTGWQPIPDTWKPEKSADEMFRDLGYEKGMSEDGLLCYDRTHRGFKERIEVCESCFISYVAEDVAGMYFGDILACAQLIREMEADNG